MNKYSGFILYLFFCIIFMNSIFGCSSSIQNEYNKAKKEQELGNYRVALSLYDRAIKRNTDERLSLLSAREGHKIAYFELKDYKKSAEYLKILILKSSDSKERIQAQETLANIYFDHMQNYEQALNEFGRLLSLALPEQESLKIRFSVAQAYYHLNQFEQSESEIKEILKSVAANDLRFNVLVLETNIFVSEKNWPKAIENYKKIITDFPEKAAVENIQLNLAASYEENNEYKNALTILEELKKTHPEPEYIELRIKKVQQRSKNQPGAKGFRK